MDILQEGRFQRGLIAGTAAATLLAACVVPQYEQPVPPNILAARQQIVEAATGMIVQPMAHSLIATVNGWAGVR